MIYQFSPGFYNRTSRPSLQSQDIDDIIRVLEGFSEFDEELQAREYTAMQQLENYKLGDDLFGILSALRYSAYKYIPFMESLT